MGNNSAMYNISYGLFVLTACEDGFDNGCIVNTVEQVTTNPNRISVTVNKQNKTHDMIMSTGVFNASIISCISKGLTSKMCARERMAGLIE